MKKGVLLPIFSLPSDYGVGDFGKAAYEFIDILSENGIEYWEILPINESLKAPYSPISFYALNIDYISLEKLMEMGLLSSAETRPKKTRITYDFYKEKYYKEAYKNFKASEEFENFCNNIELQEYAKYMTDSEGEGYEQRYYLFLQYILDKQWRELQDYARSKNVKIIGDMPIYPAFDSAEVRFHPDNFQLDDGELHFVSGAPPDGYNDYGQKWNHPLYNFDYMKMTKYRYLVEKFQEFFKRYDMVRVDHFIAFDRYYKIPVDGEPKDGFYESGPSFNFFETLFKVENSPEKILVEDLGNLSQGTEDLKEKYNFIGSKLLQFSIDLKHKQDSMMDYNRAVYTSNHDTQTMVGWYKSLKLIDKLRFRKFLWNNGCFELKVNEAIIKYCLKLDVAMIIVPVQDILGLDDNSRINMPGIETVENWSWELLDFDKLREKINILSNLPKKK